MTTKKALDNILIYSALHNGVLDSSLEIICKNLEVLEIIKERFVWLENGKLYCGRINDIQIPIDEDIEGNEEMELLREWLENE